MVHSRFKRGIYEADVIVSCLPTAKAVGYASTAPTGLNRRHIASHIHKRESVRLKPLCSFAAGLGVIAAVAAGYEVIWLWVRGCGRYAAVGVGGRHHPKLRSAYLGFSGVSPLRGFFMAIAIPTI